MITCKEDLINTYIENDHGELRDLYLAKGRRFGLYSEILKGAYTDEYVAIMPHFAAAQSCSKIPESCLGGQLTLSDLKPTKQYAVLHKGGSYSFQSDKPIGNDVVACFNLTHSEKPLSEDFFDENKQDDKQMKTYKTYQEAKIANPECEIVTTSPSWDGAVECIGTFEPLKEYGPRHVIADNAWVKCNPADYCMTVEQFLKSGYKLASGDLVIGVGGRAVLNMNGDDDDNEMDTNDKNRYILRAAALEKPKQISDTAREVFSTDSIPKLKRTKVEFVKVTESIFDLRPDFEAGELFCRLKLGDEVSFHAIESMSSLLIAVSDWNIYRKVEKEIDWRDEISNYFVEYEIADGSGEYRIDSDDFLDVCRKVLRATGELE